MPKNKSYYKTDYMMEGSPHVLRIGMSNSI